MVRVIINAGGYNLVCVPGNEEWPFFLANTDGEGMSLSEKDLEEILDKHFKENF